MEYYVYATNDCNLHCTYCSALFDCQVNNIPILPSYDTGLLTDFIQRTQQQHQDKEVRIFFFGGEPTMEYDYLKKLVTALSTSLAADYNLKFVVHTNGLLLTQMPTELRDHLSLVILSFNYEKIPAHHLAASYFSRLMEGSRQMREQRIPVTARLTITEKTSLFTSVKMLEDYYDYLYFQIENCEQFTDFQSFYATYTYEVELLFESWLKTLSEGRMGRIIPFMWTLHALFHADDSNGRYCCGYNWSQIYIQTDGECYACCDCVPTAVHRIGSLKEGVSFGNPYVRSENRCDECTYNNLCRGRCGRMHQDYDSQHIDEYCRLNRFMFDLFLQNKKKLASILKQFPQLEAELNHQWMVEIMELMP